MKIKIQRFNGTEKIVYWIFILIPIFQLLNSFIMYESAESSLGKMFRMVTLIMIVTVTRCKLDKKTLAIIISLCGVCLLTVLADTVRGIDVTLMEWSNSILKLVSPFVYYACIKKMYDKGSISKQVVYKILDFWGIFLSLSMIIPYLIGVGHQKYEGNGYTGLYYENDSLNITLCCLFAFLLSKAFKEKKTKNYIVTILIMVSVILTGSKSSLIYLVVIIFYVMFVYGGVSITKSVKRIIQLGVVIVLIAIVVNFANNNIVLNQINYYIDVYKWSTTEGGDSPLAVFSNGRTSKALYCIKNLWSYNDVNDVMFGIGGYGTEMDFFDIYMKFGLLPLFEIIVACFMIWRKCKKHNIYSFMLLLILIYAFVAGHVVESSFTAALLPLVVLALDFKENINGESMNEKNIYSNSSI